MSQSERHHRIASMLRQHCVVSEEQWHPQQEGKLQADGSYLLRIPYADHRELIMDILRHGAHCEVLGPKGLRKAVAAEVGKMRERYF